MRYLYRIYTIPAILLLFISTNLAGQDARQRTVGTIVQDVLAQMPADNAVKLSSDMQDLASSAPESVVILSGMLGDAAISSNSLIEYAINGLVNHVSGKEGGKYKSKVTEGLATAIDKCTDEVNRRFLISQFALVADASEAESIVTYVYDGGYSSSVINALVSIDGTESLIMNLIEEGKADRGLLAYAAARKHMTEAEPYLLAWLKDSDAKSESYIAEALAECGTVNSLKPLYRISEISYAELLVRLLDMGETKAAVNGAKKLLKSGETNLKVSAMQTIIAAKGNDCIPELKTVLKSDDRVYRNAVLSFMTPCTDNVLLEAVCAGLEDMEPDTRTDVMNWLGNNDARCCIDEVLACLDDGNPETVIAAIVAAGKIGGEKAGTVLCDMLSGDYSVHAYNALLSLEGDLSDLLSEVLKNGEGDMTPYLSLAADRGMKNLAEDFFAVIDKDDENALAAKKYLSGVVSNDDAPEIASLLESSAGDDIEFLQNAMISAVEGLDGNSVYSSVCEFMDGSVDASMYYPVLAVSGTDEAVNVLAEAYSGGSLEAFGGLMAIDNRNASAFLYDAALKDGSIGEKVVPRLVELASRYADSPESEYRALKDALSICTSDEMKSMVLTALSEINNMRAFLLAGEYLYDEGTAYVAAGVVKNIAANTTEEIDYSQLSKYLGKAAGIFAAHGTADDGYAVKEINKLLSEVEPVPLSELTPEEERMGFRMLFDGSDLSGWTGDKEGYTVVNGTIDVSAGYGPSGNLYTVDEYTDFIFRFEFCFVRPGINNGVGIRTPQGVDAAYDGMCEVQILDHDDPIYRDLHEYQVHGSVYGVIPAKRIKLKPLGEWNTEEIVVKGDNIKVTVNGEVIVDGNIREACKGHNVAPDGGNVNPYTVDRRNHPGMFNKKGHIGFLGHGSGLKIRNVRILELGD